MKNGGTFLDVGSNIGLFTCSVGLLPGVRCLAVEAAAAAFARLQENLSRNSGTGGISAINVAVGARRSLVRVDKPREGNLGATRVSGDGSGVEYGAHIVAAVPLNELLVAAEVRSILLMKVDVEGCEPEVLEGLDFAASYRPEHIIMEWVPDSEARRDNLGLCFEVLSDNGYEPFAVTGSSFADTQSLPEENVWWRSRRGSEIPPVDDHFQRSKRPSVGPAQSGPGRE